MAMKRKLSKRERRLVGGLGLLSGILALVFLVIIPFHNAGAEAQSDLEAEALRLEKSKNLVDKQSYYDQQLAQLDEAAARLESRLLDASSQSVASTRLLELLNTLAEQNNVAITRSNPIQERNEGNYGKVTYQLNLECQIVELTNFLAAIARHEKFLLVDEFSLNVGRTRRNQRETLRPRIRVSGVIRLS